MAFVNKIALPKISKDEVRPFNITYSEVPTAPDTNVVYIGKRFDRGNDADVGVDITSQITKSTNIVDVKDIWVPADTRKVGQYRLQIVLGTLDGATKIEANGMITVV